MTQPQHPTFTRTSIDLLTPNLPPSPPASAPPPATSNKPGMKDISRAGLSPGISSTVSAGGKAS
ncbi:hypothetical protein BO70DRAFT_364729 [Aspergillus heteromorphus CBS 117.55]|uniref:Uncharacterized protein n=1 Tax=Aspergillus heteromorphus CBS 117.55 TaxID=1448321 RepID=A0A317VF03_9EURO|nr:uncharacterized protein BO70DRAFT_364729 [Aspergillus heteromorphus CBS 117.55]PWY72953.1 hypothetical protein BO70DRAFT_364729 [Aspergillus heteromorphus CBS 117.55]